MIREITTLKLWLLSCALFLLSACGGGSDGDSVSVPPSTPAPAPTEASATIGTEGGTLIGPDGTQLVVPAGAVTAPTTFKIAKTSTGAPSDPPGDTAFSGAVYEFTPHDLTFLEPVTVTLPAGAVPAGSTQNVFTATPGDTGWRLVQSTTADGKSTWQTYAFSWFTQGLCQPLASDPLRCVQTAIDGQLTANPSTAFTEISSSPNHKAWRVTQAALFRLTFAMAAPADCGNARLVVTRRAIADTPAATLVDQALSLVVDPSDTSKARQVVNMDFTYGSADNGKYVYDVLFSCARPNGARRAVGGNAFFTVEIPVTQAPAFTGQPANLTVTEPAAATFTVAASGTPAPTLQWQRSPDGTNWVDIPGATGNSFTLPSTSASADNGAHFRAVATNSAGTATSNAAQLTVVAPVTGSWRAPETIATTQINLEPSVGFDGNGRALAVWSEVNTVNGAYRILHAARSPAGTWSAPSVLTALSLVFAPRIAVAPDGRAVVAFERGSQIVAARFDGSSWGAPVAVFTGSGGIAATNVSVGIDASGRAIVVWYGYDGARYRAYASVSTSGDTWTAAQPLDGYDAGTPQVSVNGNGKGFVIFAERNASAQFRVTAVPVDLAANPVFGTAQPLRSFVSASPGQKRIAVDGSGNAIAVWLDTDGVFGDLVWSRYDATTGTWSAHQLLAQGVGTQVANSREYNLALAMNGGGDAVVVWGQRGVNDGAVSDDVIFSRHLVAGSTTWTAVERRSGDITGVRDYAENPRVAISAAGRIAVTWIEDTGSGYKARGQIFEGGAWQPVQAIMTSANDIDVDAEHALAMDGSGMPLAVWSEQLAGADEPLLGAVWR
jgi:hypothetical protein